MDSTLKTQVTENNQPGLIRALIDDLANRWPCPACGADPAKAIDRATIDYWIVGRLRLGWGYDSVLQALHAMSLRNIPVQAADVDRLLGLAPGTTLFFNHAGFVPAEAVETEIERRTQDLRGSPRFGRCATHFD